MASSKATSEAMKQAREAYHMAVNLKEAEMVWNSGTIPFSCYARKHWREMLDELADLRGELEVARQQPGSFSYVSVPDDHSGTKHMSLQREIERLRFAIKINWVIIFILIGVGISLTYQLYW